MRTIEGCLHLGRVVLGLGGDVLMFLGTAVLLRKSLLPTTQAAMGVGSSRVT